VKLLVIIVNYRHADMTVGAVKSVLTELEGIDSRVVIVENGSGDGSLEKLQRAVIDQAWTGRVFVVDSGKNGGFGFGVNRGFRFGLEQSEPPSYFYLLNPDAYPNKGAIHALARFLDAHPEVGIAGGQTHDPDGKPHCSAFRFPTFVSELEGGLRLGVVSRLLEDFVVPILPVPDSTRKVDWVGGENMMIRRQVIEQTGGFDEEFFLYFEEVDLQWRATRAGWSIYFVHDSSVVHVGSAVTGNKDLKRRTPTYWFASRRHFFEKTYGRSGLWLANAAYVVGFGLWRVRRRVQGKPDPDRPYALYDFIRYNFRVRREDKDKERAEMVGFVDKFLKEKSSRAGSSR
jgi:GT2 family glycosyltransferase